MSSSELFVISPSEALLLGLCLGEYKAKLLANPSHEVRFMSLLESRVRPHFPSFRSLKKVPIVATELPDDIHWISDIPGDRVGTSKGDLCRVFFNSAGEYSYLKVEHPRRSFFDLLVMCASDSLALNQFERVVNSVTGIPTESDDPEELENIIAKLVSANDCSSLFEAGELFGELLSRIDAFYDYAWEVTDPMNEVTEYLVPPDDAPPAPGESNEAYLSRLVGVVKPIDTDSPPTLTVSVASLAEQVKSTRIVQRCHYAETILEQIVDLHFQVVEGSSPDPHFDAAKAATMDARHAQMCFWLAFGDVLGVLHDVDADVMAADVESAAPRSFRLTPEDEPDDVLKQIRVVEKELTTNSDVDPKDTIVRLLPLIEAIARRVWPGDFLKANNVSLARILSARLRVSTSTSAETRLASIGMSLNGSYRNPVIHEFDQFTCSFDEARYFIGAIRAMVDLWRQIMDSAS